ncbi:MAG: heavy metal-responsive transcriptional regulator [Pseudomonadota bacterium]|nr:heavy metal-responsive transcriptional regulator [Pseudomonadota bacterium]
MQIGQLASRAGVSVDTVRYYERHRILPPPQRQASGYRAYAEDDLARLQFLLRAKSLGFTLREIQELLALTEHRGRDMAGLHEAASAKLRDVERKLTDLQRIRDGLVELVAACPGEGPLERCPILGALTLEEDA